MEKFKKTMVIVGVVTLSCLLLGFSTQPFKNAEDEKILIVRTVEVATGGNSAITIVNEDGKMEKINLENLPKGISSNVITINKALNSITEKGYRLISTSGSGDNVLTIATYTFVKK